jgi:hypothetical protein
LRGRRRSDICRARHDDRIWRDHGDSGSDGVDARGAGLSLDQVVRGSEILFTHDHVAYIRFRDGERRRVPLGDEATADKVFATASEQPCPDFKIIVAIE